MILHFKVKTFEICQSLVVTGCAFMARCLSEYKVLATFHSKARYQEGDGQSLTAALNSTK